MKRYAFYAIAGSSVTAALHFLASIPWGWSALTVFVGWPLIGTLITLDDELPGGFFYDPHVKPTWQQPSFWAQILLGLGIASTVSVLEVGVASSLAVPLGLSALIAFLVSRALFLRARSQTEAL